MNKLSLLFLLLLPCLAYGKEYQVKIHVTGLPANSKPALLSIYNGDTYLIDSLPQVKDSTIIYRIPENTPTGMLRAVLGDPIERKPDLFRFPPVGFCLPPQIRDAGTSDPELPGQRRFL